MTHNIQAKCFARSAELYFVEKMGFYQHFWCVKPKISVRVKNRKKPLTLSI